MPKFEINIIIQKPVGEVYQAYTDTDNMLKWTKDLEKIEVLHGTFGESGATMLLHYNQKGRKSVLKDTLELFEPGKRIKSRITGGGLHANVETIFTPAGKSETNLTMTWNGRGDNIFITTFLNILRKKIKRSAESELILFKTLVEKHGVKFK